MQIKRSRGEAAFDTVNLVVLVLLAFTTLYPFINIFNLSLSTPAEALKSNFHLFPKDASLYGYAQILKNDYIYIGYSNTLIRTILGTFISVALSIMIAYPLSKKYLPNRNLWTVVIIITMFFQGEKIPLWQQLLLLPGLVVYHQTYPLTYHPQNMHFHP